MEILEKRTSAMLPNIQTESAQQKKRTKGALGGRQIEKKPTTENEKFLSLDAALSINNPP